MDASRMGIKQSRVYEHIKTIIGIGSMLVSHFHTFLFPIQTILCPVLKGFN